MATAIPGVARFGVGIPVAGVVTIGLFMLMRALIIPETIELEEERRALNIEITRQTEDSEIITRDRRPEKPKEVKAPPPPPRIEAAKSEAPKEGLASVLGRLPEIQPDSVDQGDIKFVVADRDIQPLVRIEPIYPRRAAERGVEGRCTMTLDVLPDGTTTNVRADCTSSLFASASTRAVERWKYAPKVEDGVAVTRFNVQTDLEYALAE